MCYSLNKKSSSRRNTVPPTEKFPSLVLSKNTITLQHLIIPIFPRYYRLIGRLREFKKPKWNFKLLALGVFAFAYERFQIFGILQNLWLRRGGVHTSQIARTEAAKIIPVTVI